MTFRRGKRSKREREIIVVDGSILGPELIRKFALGSSVGGENTLSKDRNGTERNDTICGIVGLKSATWNPLLVVSRRI